MRLFFLRTKDAAKKWGMSQVTVAKWCWQGKIKGAVQNHKCSSWYIPDDAQKPKTYNKKKNQKKQGIENE